MINSKKALIMLAAVFCMAGNALAQSPTPGATPGSTPPPGTSPEPSPTPGGSPSPTPTNNPPPPTTNPTNPPPTTNPTESPTPEPPECYTDTDKDGVVSCRQGSCFDPCKRMRDPNNPKKAICGCEAETTPPTQPPPPGDSCSKKGQSDCGGACMAKGTGVVKIPKPGACKWQNNSCGCVPGLKIKIPIKIGIGRSEAAAGEGAPPEADTQAVEAVDEPAAEE